MKDFVEKDVPTRRKKTITGRSLRKMEKKMASSSQKIRYPLARISSFIENCFLLIPKMVSTSSKIAFFIKILFPQGRKSFCTSRMNDIEKYVSTISKNFFHCKKFLKNRKKLVSTSRNMVRL